MNVFNEIMKPQHDAEMRLGNPLRDPLAIQRRLTNMAQMTRGNGFRIPKKATATDAQGKTRGQRKRARFERAFHA